MSPARAAGAVPTPPRSAWLITEDDGKAGRLGDALSAAGWSVDAVARGLTPALALLAGPLPSPEVIVTGLRFQDGDALQLIRTLARRGTPTSLFFASHQQRAVIKAAVALASTCGVGVAGFAEEPVEADDIARSLADFRPTPPVRRRHSPPPLGRDELLDLIDRGALHPWMQPKMRIRSREVTGFEALMRAHDPEGRVVMPDRLVNALSAHGLLDEATMHMARQTVAFVTDCLHDGMAVSASINVSMQSLSNLAFCQELERTVSSAMLDPSWITIEITETDAMSDLSQVIENTARIRMLGFNLSIDDFGTAYSSLYQLSRIPFSELKVERAFVTDLDRDPSRQAIVRACAQLGSSLGLHVVAEGVETAAELACVTELGCTEVQGYHVSRPMPVALALDWLRALPDMRVAA